MPRARNIKPGFFINEELGKRSPLTRLLFIGLWTIADREGRLEERPVRIKAQLLPYDNVDIEKCLSELHPVFIYRYMADEKHYIQILKFDKHQNPHIKEQASTIPAPDLHGASMELARLIPSSLIPDSPSPIEECSEPKSPAHEPSASPVVMSYPVHGKVKSWDITEAFVSDLREAFPALDIVGECRKALGWLKANPTKQKTARGMSKFLFSWCGREQDKSKGSSGTNYYNAKEEAALRHARVGQWNPPDPREGQKGW